MPDPTDYRMSPALAVATLGRGLLALGGLVVVVTVVAAIGRTGPLPTLVVAALGALVLAIRSWWLLRGWALRLTDEAYAVRGLRGVGVRRAAWAEVQSASAVEVSGTPCLVLRLRDGRSTALPVRALAGDREVVAGDVQRRLRDSHTPGRSTTDAGGSRDADPDSAPAEDSL